MSRAKGFRHTEETKRKLSELKKGKSLNTVGKKLSEEHKRKIAKANTGNKNWVGKKHTEKTKRKMSLAQKGEKHYRWKGGITRQNQKTRSSAKYKNWRLLVFQRDGFRCQVCERIGGILNAHHILPFDKYLTLRFEVTNGITLCENCHKLLHKVKKLRR